MLEHGLGRSFTGHLCWTCPQNTVLHCRRVSSHYIWQHWLLPGPSRAYVLLLAAPAAPWSKAIYTVRIGLSHAFAIPSSTRCDEPEADAYRLVESNANCITDFDGWRTGIRKHELPFDPDRLVWRFVDELQPPRGSG